MPKQVADSLTKVMDHPYYEQITDRQNPINKEIIQDVIDWWDLDLYTRKPGPAINDAGQQVGTDLDLSTFMFALNTRGAVLTFPTYKGMRQSAKRENERIISTGNRHGPIKGLFSNAKTFSFGILVKDHNVVVTDPESGREEVGAWRNFALIDVQGKWHEGWRTIQFQPSAKENDFLNDKRLWTDNTLVFKNWVHPNRWISFYGQYYLVTKLLLQRLEEESKYLYGEMNRLQNAGVKYPPSGTGAKMEWPRSEVAGEKKSIEVRAFEVEVDFPEFENEYPETALSTEELVRISDRRRDIIYDWKKKLHFAARCVEYAFCNHGIDYSSVFPHTGQTREDGYVEKFPAWIKDASWERGYVVAGKRIQWNRLVLFQPAVGELGVSLRYRSFKKKEQIAAD